MIRLKLAFLTSALLCFGCVVSLTPLNGTRLQTQGQTRFDDLGNGGGAVDVSTFNTHLAEAKKLLLTVPTGSASMADLDQLTASGHVVGIVPIASGTIGHAGKIRQIASGVYEIKLRSDLSALDLAQCLAHELIHVDNEIAEDKFLETQSDLNSRMGKVANLQPQDLAPSYATNKRDIDFFYESVMFQEVKGYQLNLQLDKEGIPFHNGSLISMGLFAYVKASYVPTMVTVGDADGGASFMQRVSKNSNLVNFQKDILIDQN